MPDSIAEAAYELALRAIDQQERRLNELRARTGTLIAGASVAASFLGGQAARTSDLDLAGGLAVVGYLVCVASALYVLLPHRLVLEFRGSVMLKAAAGVDHVTVEEALRAASGWIERFHERNRDELQRLTRWYTIACAGLGFEIVLWIVSLGDMLSV
jgi:hypothetical protein